ncbi:Mur ligase [Stachybotrys elegans]|uniref:Mur ligase n=1 Tax=Stachybotrys elegans TaxID=80388 RepID=A0A8K0SZM5_9HYPO|nr:Mur ligase [Stachybotrys elegans]
MVYNSAVGIGLAEVRHALRNTKGKPRSSVNNWRYYMPLIDGGGLARPGDQPFPRPRDPGDDPDAESSGRDIRLGLKRIQKIVPSRQKWKAVHVGGTNGKGSICAFLDGLFRLAGISHGTFTSPAFPEKHNGITINGLVVNRRFYESRVERVLDRCKRYVAPRFSFKDVPDPQRPLGAPSPFEIETATAFEVFNAMRVKYGIIEVGMGGATDATNILMKKAVTVISKIDLDHQEYLGNTIREIARVKAGIMRPGVPCIVDHTNSAEVLDVLRTYARRVEAKLVLSSEAQPLLRTIDKRKYPLEDYQKQNLLCAIAAFQNVAPGQQIDLNMLLATNPFPPGRMQRVHVSEFTGGQRLRPILVDGAHNALGVQALSKYVDEKLRSYGGPVTWVMGLSQGRNKPFAELIKTLVRPQDNFAFVQFEKGDQDPLPAPTELGRDVARILLADESQLYEGPPNIEDALHWATAIAGEGPVVVTGSLYLARDLLKLDQVAPVIAPTKERRAGRALLAEYITKSRQGKLTPEEKRAFKEARRHWYLNPHGMMRRLYLEQTGNTEWPPRPSDEARELQRSLNSREKKVDAYRVAIESMREEIENMKDEIESMKEDSAKQSSQKGELEPKITKLKETIKSFMNLKALLIKEKKTLHQVRLELKNHSILRQRPHMSPELVQPSLRPALRAEKRIKQQAKQKRDRARQARREMTLNDAGEPVAVEVVPRAKEADWLGEKEEEGVEGEEAEEPTELFPGEESDHEGDEAGKKGGKRSGKKGGKGDADLDKVIDDEFMAYFRRSRRTM